MPGPNPRPQTAKNSAGRALNSSKQGLPKVSSKDFETFTAMNMVRILRSAARLLENTEEEAQELVKGRTSPPNNREQLIQHSLATTLPLL